MQSAQLRWIVAACLVIGAVLGMAGTFTGSDAVRGLAWGLDGTALIIAAALLTVHHLKRGNELAAAGFLVFVAGETAVLAGSLAGFLAGASLFGAGTGLWAAALAMVSASRVMPNWLRGVGLVAALLFAIVAIQAFLGGTLTPISQPLPFFAYPFLAVTLFGWAWVHLQDAA